MRVENVSLIKENISNYIQMQLYQIVPMESFLIMK